jgi:hypothetical protein
LALGLIGVHLGEEVERYAGTADARTGDLHARGVGIGTIVVSLLAALDYLERHSVALVALCGLVALLGFMISVAGVRGLWRMARDASEENGHRES